MFHSDEESFKIKEELDIKDEIVVECAPEEYNQNNEQSFKIKEEELDINDGIVVECASEKYSQNAIEKMRKEYTYKCEDCNYSTNLSRQLDQHMIRKHHLKTELNIKKHNCSKCEYSTSYAKHLRRHHLNKHTPDEEINWFKCTNCDYKGKTKWRLKVHQLTHSPMKNFQCNDCAYSTKSKDCLVSHIRRKHQTEEQVEMYYCDKCDYRTKIKKDSSSHTRKKHWKINLKKYACKECNYSTYRKSYMKVHVIHKHTPDEQIKYHHCKKCDHKSKTKGQLTAHEQIHSDQLFPCEFCEYIGKTRAQLGRHLSIKHLKQNAYKCKKCPYNATYSAQRLRLHVLSKHTPKDQIQYFYCGHCNYKAKIKYILQNHIRKLHSKDRPMRLQCPDCSFTTIYKKSLENHGETHHRTKE